VCTLLGDLRNVVEIHVRALDASSSRPNVNQETLSA
jgi:hypothetical protein